LAKFKRDGGKFIAVNPVRSGYAAIADEWVPIKPGTDGALLLAIIHEIIAQGLYDRDFLMRYTNSPDLVNVDLDSDEFGLFLRSEIKVEESCIEPANKMWWDRARDQAVHAHAEDTDPRLLGEFARIPIPVCWESSNSRMVAG
jgi:anaerobic selenocysteine-containing dehydrogenase